MPLHAAPASSDRRSLGGVGAGGVRVAASALRRRARIGAFATLATAAVWLVVAATASAFSAHGSVEQVYVTGLAPNAQMSLLRSNGETVATQSADSLGGLLFRKVAPGRRYRVQLTSTSEESGPITVHTQKAAPWDRSIYKQSIPDSGYTYLTTRDGTQLAIDVHPPASPPTKHKGAYPTLIEYSGYGYANPAGPESGLAAVANEMGFAVVDVNMRGTGCSGGAFDYFEPLREPRRLRRDRDDRPPAVGAATTKSGCSASPTAGSASSSPLSSDPPALEAIAPLSVVDATATTLYPGGVLNTGFAVPWAEDRQFDAEPAGPSSGEHWAYEQIQKGDTTCAANQDLHGEATNLLAEVKENATYNPSVADPLDPVTFVHNIDVPTFMACQWEDEQTGGHCADLAEHFTGTEHKWFTFTNGAHIDSLDPYTLDRLDDFLELFVAHQAPISNTGVAAWRWRRSSMRPRWGSRRETRSRCRRTRSRNRRSTRRRCRPSQALPEIRVLFDNGAGSSPTAAKRPATPIRHSNSRSRRSRSRARRSLVVPRARRRTRRRTGNGRRRRLLHLGCERHAADGLHGRRGPGRAVGRRVRSGLELGAAAGGLRRLLRVRTARPATPPRSAAAPSTSG